LTDGEGPAVKTGTESDRTLLRVHLTVSESLVEVGGDNDIDGLYDTSEVLEQILLGQLKLEKRTVDLVDDDNRLDTLTKSLAEHSLGLHAHTLNGVDNDKRTVGDTESGGDLRGEINVTRRVDQVNQELVLLSLDRDILEILLVRELTEQGDGGRFNGDTSFLLIRTSVCEPSGTGILG
jgi:hypothetical protein